MVLGILLAALVLTVLHYRYWTRRFALPQLFGTVERVQTDGGGMIELRRLGPPATPTLPPVLIVHGVAANHRNTDAEPERSLARLLHQRGRDVWLVTLRSGITGFRGDASFRSMVEEDLPVAFRTVRARTRADALDYVGFSMGGILLYAALGRSVPAEQLNRAVFIGSPGQVPAWAAGWSRLPLIPWIATLFPLRFLARMFAFMVGWVHTPIHSMVIQRGNSEAQSAQWAMANMIQSIPRVLLHDFIGFARRGGVIDVGGEPILPALARVTAPVRFFAGSKDLLSPVSAVRAAFDAWGGAETVDKALVVLGPNNDSDEGLHYGHGDLAIGRHVVADLFEPVSDFLGSDPKSVPSHSSKS